MIHGELAGSGAFAVRLGAPGGARPHLRHLDDGASCDPPDDTPAFAAAATFCAHAPFQGSGQSYASLESVNSPGQYLIHGAGQLRLPPVASTDAFNAAATWFVREP